MNREIMRQTKFYHGGVRNLKIGQFLNAPLITFNRRTSLHISDSDKAGGHAREDKVFVTTDINAARVYASSYPFGDVYEVIPQGNIYPDPDAPDISLMCDVAEIVSIVQRRVKFKIKRLEVMVSE